jgi:two-component system chemotaxis response regulator CheY
MRRIILNVLARLGYTDVVEAENGKRGLELLDQGGIEVIITDWNMPVMDGLEFVQNVRRNNRLSTPILMVTTNAAKEDIVAALQAGVNNYVVKPFTPDTLKQKIELILS